jgi:hypothetical protein
LCHFGGGQVGRLFMVVGLGRHGGSSAGEEQAGRLFRRLGDRSAVEGSIEPAFDEFGRGRVERDEE